MLFLGVWGLCRWVWLLGGGSFVLLVAALSTRLVRSLGSRRRLWWWVGFELRIARVALLCMKGRWVAGRCGLLPSVG